MRRQESELERIRALATSWVPEFRSGGNAAPTELIEVVTGADTVLSRFDQLQRGAMEEVQVLDTPPYAGDAGPVTNDAEFEVLARGVTCRAIYARAALEQSPNAVTAMASGLKDEAIAHHLGWSHRTTRRRIATLMSTLGADTRFQAGLYAARAGWL